jgi:hypothetical protein
LGRNHKNFNLNGKKRIHTLQTLQISLAGAQKKVEQRQQ